MIQYYLGRKYVRADLPMAASNVRHNRRQRHMDDDTLVRYAEAALERPGSFAYFGGVELFWSWGLAPVAQTRDSDPLERSNYRRILQDMMKAAPDEDMGEHVLSWVTDFRSSHWAYGWMEQILVRVLYDPEEGIAPPNITAPFRMIAEIADYTDKEYPVYDEEDYSKLEHEQQWESFAGEWKRMCRRWDDEDGPEPAETERDYIWSAYDLMYEDSRKDADTLEEHVLSERAGRIDAAKAAVRRILHA